MHLFALKEQTYFILSGQLSLSGLICLHWRGSFNSKIKNSRPLVIYIFEPKIFISRVKWVLGGVLTLAPTKTPIFSNLPCALFIYSCCWINEKFPFISFPVTLNNHFFRNTNKIRIINDFQNHDNQNSCAYKQRAVDFFCEDFLSKFHKTNSYFNWFSIVRNQLRSCFAAKKKSHLF